MTGALRHVLGGVGLFGTLQLCIDRVTVILVVRGGIITCLLVGVGLFVDRVTVSLVVVRGKCIFTEFRVRWYFMIRFSYDIVRITTTYS